MVCVAFDLLDWYITYTAMDTNAERELVGVQLEVVLRDPHAARPP